MTEILNFAIFSGRTFYPEGGIKDLKKFANTINEAEIIAKNIIGFDKNSIYIISESIDHDDWSHIVDLKNMKIIAELTCDFSNSEYDILDNGDYIFQKDKLPLLVMLWNVKKEEYKS